MNKQDFKDNDWNPQLYLKFKNERTQPSIDLVSRINLENPQNIIDIGCGPGNSTRVLVEKWPYAKITGLDNSKSMIEKAKNDFPEQSWILSDASTFHSNNKFDIIFSNATVQWLPDHSNLMVKWFNLLNKNGVLAVQFPLFHKMPLGKSISKIAKYEKWKNLTKGCDELFTFHDAGFYYDVLGNHSSTIEIWETSYMHVLDSHAAILEWIRSTGLKPYLERLNSGQMKNEFENYVLGEICNDYPTQKNGKVLFPFYRLFFVAYN